MQAGIEITAQSLHDAGMRAGNGGIADSTFCTPTCAAFGSDPAKAHQSRN
jgi:hypothetical protein